MLIYSAKIGKFIREIAAHMRSILTAEVGIGHITKSYFSYLGAWHPITIVIYDDRKALAYYDHNFKEFGFHEKLLYVPKNQLFDIIRHEIAHCLTMARYGSSISPHGAEFVGVCRGFGWGDDVSKATICLDIVEEHVREESAVLRRVEKLMALSTSNNPHEAQQALIKAQELLLKHNLEVSLEEVGTEDVVCLKRVFSAPKKDGKMVAIGQILQTFFVSVVFHRAAYETCLEVIGEKVNVEIAEYVVGFLDKKLDELWCEAQVSAGLRGLRAKNSFFYGIASGYKLKVERMRKQGLPQMEQALVRLEKKIEDMSRMVYPSLSSSRSQGWCCGHSLELGEQAGNALTIRPGVKGDKSSQTALLGCS